MTDYERLRTAAQTLLDAYDGDGTPEIEALRAAMSDPCPECGQYGACSYDTEGRALIHVTPDTEETQQ